MNQESTLLGALGHSGSISEPGCLQIHRVSLLLSDIPTNQIDTNLFIAAVAGCIRPTTWRYSTPPIPIRASISRCPNGDQSVRAAWIMAILDRGPLRGFAPEAAHRPRGSVGKRRSAKTRAARMSSPYKSKDPVKPGL